MAATITDDELRNRLSSILGSNQTIPPIVDSTRSFLLEKLSQLQCGGELEIISKTNKPSGERVKVRIQKKIIILPVTHFCYIYIFRNAAKLKPFWQFQKM